MSAISLLVALMILATILAVALAECDTAECQSKAPEEGDSVQEQCRKGWEAYACGEALLNNTDCPDIIKKIAKDQLVDGKKELDAKCSGDQGTDCGGGAAAGLMSSLIVCLGLSCLTYILISFKPIILLHNCADICHLFKST
uniref:Saposin B-type domain-containing protein n=1 Tax=Arion vulgaris TaxID=1028688 RepID=A0A0B7A8D6_9EUPU